MAKSQFEQEKSHSGRFWPHLPETISRVAELRLTFGFHRHKTLHFVDGMVFTSSFALAVGLGLVELIEGIGFHLTFFHGFVQDGIELRLICPQR